VRTPTITTQTDVRAAFWQEHEQFYRIPGKTQNDYPTDVRCAFVDYVDRLACNGEITEELAARVTL
jgi:uncharacterized protein (DUF2236 family)